MQPSGSALSIFFCGSHISLPYVIDAILASKLQDFVVLTTERSLVEPLTELFSAEKIIFIENPGCGVTSNPGRLLVNLRRVRKAQSVGITKIQHLQNGTVFFYDLFANCEFEQWLLLQLSRSNKITFLPVLTLTGTYRDIGFPKAQLFKLIGKIFYGICGQPTILTHARTYRLSEHFLRKISARELDPPKIDADRLLSYVANRFSLQISANSIIWLAGGVATFVVEEEEYLATTNAILDRLHQHLSKDALLVKPHPRENALYGKEKVFAALPSVVPLSALISTAHAVIGYSSYGLVEAASSGKKAISTLFLYKPMSTENAEQHKNYLERNAKGSIFFPKSIDELVTMI